MADLNRRQTQRGIIQRTRDVTIADDFETKPVAELKERLNRLKIAFETYNEVHTEICEAATDAAAMTVQDRELAQTEAMYFDAMAKLETRIDALDNELEENIAERNRRERANEPVQREHRSEMRLERLTVRIFAGKYSEWPEWKAMYESLIHDARGLDETQKFHYLVKSLHDPAARLLSGWTIVGDNYQAAYQTVKDVYDNRYRIIMAYLDDWHKTPFASQETFESLRTIVDNSKRAIRQLRVIGSPTEHWDQIFVYGISIRMPPRTVTAWETTHDLKEMPTLDEVWKFLEKRARGLLYSSNTPNQEKSNKGQFNQQRPSTSQNYANTSQQYTHTDQTPKPMPSSKTNGKSVECYNCKGAHTMFDCENFKKMNTQARQNRVRELNLCLNCFSPNHKANSQSCKSGACQRCNRGLKHNRLLCNTNVMTTRAINMAPTPSTFQNASAPNQEPQIGAGAQQSNGTVTYQPHWMNNNRSESHF